MSKWEITKEEVSRANQLAEQMTSEVNIKEYAIPLGENDEGQEVEVIYLHNTIKDAPEKALDVYINNIPQGKEDFAAWVFLKQLRGSDDR